MNETVHQDINGGEWYNKIAKLYEESALRIEVKVTHSFGIDLCCNFSLENLSKMKGFELENFSRKGDLIALSHRLNFMDNLYDIDKCDP